MQLSILRSDVGVLANSGNLISRRAFIAGATCVAFTAVGGGLLAAEGVSKALATDSGASDGAEAAGDPNDSPANAESNTSLWFSPHQDDESLVLAAGILADVANGRDVHVILCTDGSATAARKELADGSWCSLCNTKHAYELMTEQITAARDDEFRRSCAALGIPAENVHINGSGEGTTRVKDTQLDEESATGILNHYLERFPNAKVGLISPLSGSTQHRDHRRLGRAATRLQAAGKIGHLDLFVEPYCYEAYLANSSPKLKGISCDDAAADGYRTFLDSFNEYKSFDPERGRYAVGLHSAPELFNNPPAENTTHCYRSMLHQLVRYAGSSRYDTMKEAVLDAWESAHAAVIVSGETFADALATAPLAGCLDAPVLITAPSTLSAQTRECLETLGVGEAYIVGGEAAVSSAVEKQLAGRDIAVSRISGSSRQATACALAAKVLQLKAAADGGMAAGAGGTGGTGGTGAGTAAAAAAAAAAAKTCIVVSGDSYADALSITPHAFASRIPMFLATSGDVSDETVSAIKGAGFTKMLLVGGEASVSSKVASKCGIYDAHRISGADSSQTCAEVARYSLEQGASIAGFAMAGAQSFTDALMAASCAARRSTVALLVQEPYKTCASVLDLLAEAADDIDLAHNACYAFGNTAALSEDLAETVVCAATPLSDD